MDLLDFLFPKFCVGCGKEGEYFCRNCIPKIKTVSLVCPVCEKASPFGQTHPKCKNKYSLDGLTSIFAYEGIAKDALHKIKYKFVTEISKELMDLVFKEINKEREKKHYLFNTLSKEKRPVVVPIPLHWYKENTRGFNQAGLIGKFLSKELNLPINERLLKRKKFTVSQTDLSEKERKENVKGIFSVSPIIHRSLFGVLLIDDVWTTGATMKEAAGVLKKAGVEEVWGLTIAR